MKRFDRILALLLLLRGGQAISAAEAAERFGVSPRTIYRDIDSLSVLGVPVYAERGREGGFRLLEGYFLPPLMFSVREAISIFLGLTLLRTLPARPFEAELDTVEKKLLAAVPDHLRAILARAYRFIGFEKPPRDIFHPEPAETPLSPSRPTGEGETVSLFLQAILDRRSVHIRYRSPYRDETQQFTLDPRGVFWDRDRWYLVGRLAHAAAAARLWRADRVLELKAHHPMAEAEPDFDVRELLNRRWLKTAVGQWSEEATVKIRLSRRQAETLQLDWYYGQAYFEPLADEQMLMVFGEDDRDHALALLRWLGPGAELLEPQRWRAALAAELQEMLRALTGEV